MPQWVPSRTDRARRWYLLVIVLLGGYTAVLPTMVHGQTNRRSHPHGDSKVNDADVHPAEALATFGSGCFWCTEAVFEQLRGVTKVVSGYSGGSVVNPTYEQVSSRTTGHAEVIQLTYDPSVISYEDLLEVFWKTHDPTTLNQQGDDIGPQYRSVIFYHNESQREAAEKLKSELDQSGAFGQPIVTEITRFTEFYPAEAYHQDYFRLNGRQPYCSAVIRPKVRKVRQVFRDRLKTQGEE